MHFQDNNLNNITVGCFISWQSFLFFSSEREAKESEEKKGSTRTFLRHRFLSKDEEAQKIPGVSLCLIKYCLRGVGNNIIEVFGYEVQLTFLHVSFAVRNNPCEHS